MQIELNSCGKKSIVNLPDAWDPTFVYPRNVPALDNPLDEISSAIQTPFMTKSLTKLISDATLQDEHSQDYICIVISPSISSKSISLFLQELNLIFQKVHIPDSKVKILLAMGTAQKPSPKAIRAFFGMEILMKYDIFIHQAQDKVNQQYIGDTSLGKPIYLNKIYLSAKFKIILDRVNPHPYYNYSGSAPMMLLSIAGSTTVQSTFQKIELQSKKSSILADFFQFFKSKPAKPDFTILFAENSNHTIIKIKAGAHQVFDQLKKHVDNSFFGSISKLADVVFCSIEANYDASLKFCHSHELQLIEELGAILVGGNSALVSGGTLIIISECSLDFSEDNFSSVPWMKPILEQVLNRINVVITNPTPSRVLQNFRKNSVKYLPDIFALSRFCQKQLSHSSSILIFPDILHALPKLKE